MKSAGVKDNNDNDNDNNNNEGSRIIPNTGGHTVFNADNDDSSSNDDLEVDVHRNNSIVTRSGINRRNDNYSTDNSV